MPLRPETEKLFLEKSDDTLDRVSGRATGGTPTQWSIVFDTENLRVPWHTSRSPQARSMDFGESGNCWSRLLGPVTR